MKKLLYLLAPFIQNSFAQIDPNVYILDEGMMKLYAPELKWYENTFFLTTRAQMVFIFLLILAVIFTGRKSKLSKILFLLNIFILVGFFAQFFI